MRLSSLAAGRQEADVYHALGDVPGVWIIRHLTAIGGRYGVGFKHPVALADWEGPVLETVIVSYYSHDLMSIAYGGFGGLHVGPAGGHYVGPRQVFILR